MPEPFTTYKSNLNIDYVELGSILLNFRNYFYYIGDQIAAQNWNEAKNQLYNLGNYVGSYLKPAMCDSSGLRGSTWYCMDWIDDNWGNGNGEVTMDAIIEAMVGADYMELQHFIAIVDAYRVALWGDWFDAGLHTELVRAFKRTK